MHVKYFIDKFLNQRMRERVLVVRSWRFLLPHYFRLRFAELQKPRMFYFIIDPMYKHPGLADRLKAILGCYYIAQRNGLQFKLIFSHPYELSQYMAPASVDWHAEESELEYTIRGTRFFCYSALRKGTECKLNKTKQYHCRCYKGDDLFYVNGQEYQKNFGLLFQQLFVPSQSILAKLDQLGLEHRGYVSVHARFVNSLGVFEDPKYPTLPVDEQERLIERCHKAIRDICRANELPVLVFSDSKCFLDTLTSLPVRVLSEGTIGHLSHSRSESSVFRTFLDFWAISRSACTYRLLSPAMYATNFSLYASFAGSTPVKDVNV